MMMPWSVVRSIYVTSEVIFSFYLLVFEVLHHVIADFTTGHFANVPFLMQVPVLYDRKQAHFTCILLAQPINCARRPDVWMGRSVNSN